MSHGFEVFSISRSDWFKRCKDIFERLWNSSKVMCVDDANIGLKDSRRTDVVQVNLFFKVIFV